MNLGSRTAPGRAAAWSLALAVASFGCGDKERKDIDQGAANAAAGPSGNAAGAGGGGGRGGGGAVGGGSGDGGAASSSESATGTGGAPATPEVCACLLDQSSDSACGSCLGFATLDECGDDYDACQADEACPAIDDCILNSQCADAGCIEDCRTLGTPVGNDLLDDLYECACEVCAAECSGSTCD
jgi:hypothetical protein